MLAVARMDDFPSVLGFDNEPTGKLDVDSLTFDHPCSGVDLYLLAKGCTVSSPLIQNAVRISKQLVERFEQPLDEKSTVDLLTKLLSEACGLLGKIGSVNVGVDADTGDQPRNTVFFALHLRENPREFPAAPVAFLADQHVIRPFEMRVDAGLPAG